MVLVAIIIVAVTFWAFCGFLTYDYILRAYNAREAPVWMFVLATPAAVVCSLHAISGSGPEIEDDEEDEEADTEEWDVVSDEGEVIYVSDLFREHPPRSNFQELILAIAAVASPVCQAIGGYAVYRLAVMGVAPLGYFGVLCMLFLATAVTFMLVDLITFYSELGNPCPSGTYLVNRDWWQEVFFVEVVLLTYLTLPRQLFLNRRNS